MKAGKQRKTKSKYSPALECGLVRIALPAGDVVRFYYSKGEFAAAHLAQEFAEKLRPECELIETFSGKLRDTVYKKQAGIWRAYTPTGNPLWRF